MVPGLQCFCPPVKQLDGADPPRCFSGAWALFFLTFISSRVFSADTLADSEAVPCQQFVPAEGGLSPLATARREGLCGLWCSEVHVVTFYKKKV